MNLKNFKLGKSKYLPTPKNLKYFKMYVKMQEEGIHFSIIKNNRGEYGIDFLPINLDPRKLFLCSDCQSEKFEWFDVDSLVCQCTQCKKFYTFSRDHVKPVTPSDLKDLCIKKLEGDKNEKHNDVFTRSRH